MIAMKMRNEYRLDARRLHPRLHQTELRPFAAIEQEYPPFMNEHSGREMPVPGRDGGAGAEGDEFEGQCSGKRV